MNHRHHDTIFQGSTVRALGEKKTGELATLDSDLPFPRNFNHELTRNQRPRLA